MAIHRTKAGTYAVDFYDPFKKQRRKTFDTRREAEGFEIQIRAQVRRGEYSAPTKQTVDELARQWFGPKENGEYRGSSARYWRNHIDGFIVPELGSLKMPALASNGFDLITDAMAAWHERVAGVTCNKVLTTLTAVLDLAVRKKLLQSNPAKLVERFKIATENEDGDVVERDRVYSEQELRQLIAATETGTVERAFIMCLALLGLRIGEALALTWPVIDLSGGVDAKVKVFSNLGDGDKGHGPNFQAPKSKSSRRLIPLPEGLAHELRKWKLRCPVNPRGLVFARADGGRYNRQSLAKFLDAAIERAGVKRLTPHGLRHTFASLLLDRGTPIAEVSEYLGHKGSDVTLRIYTHFIRGKKSTAVQDLAAAIVG